MADNYIIVQGDLAYLQFEINKLITVGYLPIGNLLRLNLTPETYAQPMLKKQVIVKKK